MIGVMASLSLLSDDEGAVEAFLNPAAAFEAVHIVSLVERSRGPSRHGSVHVYPVAVRAPRFVPTRVIGLLIMAKATRTILRIVASEAPHLIVQLFATPLKFGLPAVYAANRAGLPCVISLHSDYEKAMRWTYSTLLRWLAERAWRYLFGRATRIRSVSTVGVDFALARGAPSDRISVIPNKEELSAFRDLPSESELQAAAVEFGFADLPVDAISFLTVGRLISAKNIDGMMRGFSRSLRDGPEQYYFVAGDGPELPRLERLALDLGIRSRVRFLGFVDRSRLNSIYRLSDVLAFATHYEGQPRVVVEAMLAGLPVLCSDFGQATEIVRPEIDGLWADPQDPDSIGAAMLRLARDSGLRRRASLHEGFDAEQFSLDVVGKREAALYVSAIREYERGTV